jgi:hypothetical protein
MAMSRRALMGAGAAGLLAAPALRAQEASPSRPIRLVVPYPPGAINDMLARWVADKMPEVFGQPGVVENRPGAAGNIGTTHVARSAPDGYTIGIGNTPILAVNPFVYPNMGYDPRTEISLVGIAARLMNVLCYGTKAESFCYVGMRGLVEVADFWPRYVAEGRCAIDPEHKRHFVGDDTRWTQDGDTRACLWCGKARQVLVRWTETVERQQWRDLQPNVLVSRQGGADE